ncbi:Epimerase, SDR39I1 family [Desulfonema limicola]|uniref:Epimerase, SDR39I1 family n=1 Tax=Desulfonema limicola TaxID=45656 RepID=A0A975GFA2_9BACT|nr:TIGR01777 family oxidoreductase [Desulfonema limicola]QTA79018.1 Epimerase, SDR39I1 family [Desulfonema limicola]
MKIFISGGTGFVGQNLSKQLLNAGHSVIASGTRPEQKNINHKNFLYLPADTTKTGEWQKAVGDSDAVVNLAGRNIFNYWTKSYKQDLYNSRILTTRNIVDALPDKDIVLCSASAVGFYGDCKNEIITENSPGADDFLAMLSKDWEAEALKAEAKGARVVLTRFGIILGKNGGAMKQMLPAFRFGLGGPLGRGSQWFPWIHADDITGTIIFILENHKIQGPVNLTAPGLIQQKDFAKILGSVLKRPAFMPAPGFMIKIIMGELGNVLLTGQKVMPEKLLKSGYSFKFPDIRTAVEDIIKSA